MFLIFAGDDYYPRGGALDFKAITDDAMVADDIARECLLDGADWAQVAFVEDRSTASMVIVSEMTYDPIRHGERE